jgi:phospholipase C
MDGAVNFCHQFVISRRRYDPAADVAPDTASAYGLWCFDPDATDLLTAMPLAPHARLDWRHELVQIGDYLLEWGPEAFQEYAPSFPYRLFSFDSSNPDPLGVNATVECNGTRRSTTIQKGLWTKKKFWGYRADFGNLGGARENWQSATGLNLIPIGSWLLEFLPTEGRATFGLWNFDPAPMSEVPADPLTGPFQQSGSFDVIDATHQLIPLGNYMLDWVPKTGDYRVLSFDPQNAMPLALPAVQQGRWGGIGAHHQLVPMGELVLDWMPADRSYRLWRFDPKCADPLRGPLRSGTLPAGFDATTVLTGVLPRVPLPATKAPVPGTMEFMRSKIKHVVYLMLENRSFDHVCGWLYEKGEQELTFVGHDGPFDGVSTDMFNVDPGKNSERVHVSKYLDGKPPVDQPLDFLPDDPYHDVSDVLRQCFYGTDGGYAACATPKMGGFVWNNGIHQVMMTYTPEQLPVLNGLAKNFAISDEWFSSTPGPTDPNRAFAFTGSSMQELNNFQNDNIYEYWPAFSRRQSLWKVLWSQGVSDWKMYYSVEWENFVHTYHLFLAGQTPSIDSNQANFIEPIHSFKSAARAGTLPAFSYVEPIWIAKTGTTSYHPGADPALGECALADIYDAVRAGPAWNETLFIITFDEHGGIFDHAPPPRAEKPWPNDSNGCFNYDMFGPRIPAILVSPWIEPQTVFRSGTMTPFDHTSVIATLLHWFGIPRSQWALGDRVHHAPTFETVLRRQTPRTDTPANMSKHSCSAFGTAAPTAAPSSITGLQRQMAAQILWHLVKDKLSSPEAKVLVDDIFAHVTDVKALYAAIDRTAVKYQ